MRQHLPIKQFLLFMCSFMLMSSTQAGKIYIKGTVKYPDGKPAAFQSVYIRTDSSIAATTCRIFKEKRTNQNGFYQDTIECNLSLTNIIISVPNCDGSILTKSFTPNSNNEVESNFIICTIPVCTAWFNFSKDTLSNGRRYHFNAAGSTTNPGDSIIERTWVWGNGDTLKGNSIDPAYTYTSNGSYKICLIIKTKKGCSNTICREVNVMPVCKAAFTLKAEPAAGNSGYTFNFTSAHSVAPSIGDEITARIWKWGDGTTENGNKIELQKTFTAIGNYNTCLIIKTKNGCADTACTNIAVPAPGQAGCKANFTYQPNGRGKTVYFNSRESYPLLGDSIVKRTWTFGDGSIADGNKIDLVKEYKFAGKFNACLEIKSLKGCISKVCKTIELRDSTDTIQSGELIKLISIHPNPVITSLTAIIWSERENVQAELIITNLTGTRKWLERKNLVKGNNIYTIPVGNLPKGPYFFKISTGLGTKARQFYKM